MGKRRWAELGLMAASFALCVGVSEISLRAALPISPLDEGGPPPTRAQALRYEGSVFSRNVLAASALDVENRDRRYHVNSLGYRGTEFPVAKPAGTLRVAVYGGSAVFDIYARDEDAWPAQLERELESRGVAGVEVINAGIPAHSSLDSVGRLFAEGHHFSPDVVVLYNAWNDIKYFVSDEPVLRRYRPYARRNDPVRTPRGRMDAWLARHSQIYRHLRLRILLWDQDFNLEGRKVKRETPASLSDIQLAQYRLAVRQFVDLARNIGSEPVLVTQMRLPVAASPAEDRERIHYDAVGLDHDTLVTAFEVTERILADVSREKGALLVDPSGELSGESALFADHVHLSGEGSAALAAFLADRLAPALADLPRS